MGNGDTCWWRQKKKIKEKHGATERRTEGKYMERQNEEEKEINRYKQKRVELYCWLVFVDLDCWFGLLSWIFEMDFWPVLPCIRWLVSVNFCWFLFVDLYWLICVFKFVSVDLYPLTYLCWFVSADLCLLNWICWIVFVDLSLDMPWDTRRC